MRACARGVLESSAEELSGHIIERKLFPEFVSPRTSRRNVEHHWYYVPVDFTVQHEVGHKVI
jgi:hypothetical protein